MAVPCRGDQALGLRIFNSGSFPLTTYIQVGLGCLALGLERKVHAWNEAILPGHHPFVRHRFAGQGRNVYGLLAAITVRGFDASGAVRAPIGIVFFNPCDDSRGCRQLAFARCSLCAIVLGRSQRVSAKKLPKKHAEGTRQS